MSTSIELLPDEDYHPDSMPEIFQLVERVEKKLKQIQRETIKETNLTPPQYVVMTLLWEQDSRPFKELAAAVQCTRATMTGLVDTLEKKNLVARAPNPNDRRSLLVKLTDEGKNLQKSTPTLDRIFHGCCVGLKPEEAHQLSYLLKKLDASLSID
jgi:DNA-binding MarR family transcriptional regulator